MAQTKALFHGLDIAISVSCLVAIASVWLAFDRQMCANSAGGACSPNVVYIAAAILAGLLAVGTFGLRRRVGS